MDITVTFNLYDGSHSALDDLKRYDRWAADSIARAEKAIAEAKEYRLQLAKRAASLITQNAHTRVTLSREPNYWDKKVFYYLKTHTVYEDGTKCLVDSVKFTGTERHEALNKFKELKRQYPHYEFIEDILKK